MKKNIFITGATDGIGKLVALKFSNEGHTLFLHGRNTEKLSSTVKEIKSISNNENIKAFVADLSDFDSINKMANNITEEIKQIDVLINNAGVFKSNISHNKEGYDVRFMVNYFAPYLLTNKLLPLLKNSNSARIINLSSAAQSTISYDALEGNENLNVNEAYAQSKLALSMWSFHLAKEHNEISVIAVNPGSLLNTKMALEAYGTHWSKAEKGRDILYELAISEKYNGITAKYFDNDKGEFSNAHPDVYNDKEIAKLIQITDKLIG